MLLAALFRTKIKGKNTQNRQTQRIRIGTQNSQFSKWFLTDADLFGFFIVNFYFHPQKCGRESFSLRVGHQ